MSEDTYHFMVINIEHSKTCIIVQIDQKLL